MPTQQELFGKMEDRLINCDCLESMKSLPSGCIDLTVTSPPYDTIRTCYPGLSYKKFQQVARQLYRITKPGGVVVWCAADQRKDGSLSGTTARQQLYFQQIGFRLHEKLIMARYGYRSTCPDCYGPPLEEAFILAKGSPMTVNLLKDRKNKSEGRLRVEKQRYANGEFCERPAYRASATGKRLKVWRYAVGKHAAAEPWVRQAAHGAYMPEKQAEDLILSYSRAGDLVFDPFSGCGTTAKMALVNHRHYLGFEIMPEFHRLAERRLTLAWLSRELQFVREFGSRRSTEIEPPRRSEAVQETLLIEDSA